MTKLLLTLALGFALNANAATLKVDPASSTIQWTGSKKVGAVHTGKIAVKDGQVETNAKNEITSGSFTIDMTTIADEDLAKDPEHQKKLQGHLSSADFFNIEKFPTSTFKITSISKKGKGLVNITGDLTLVGKTNSISFPANVTTDAAGLKGEAKFKIDRTKWGLKYGSGNFFKELTADKIINNDIEFDLKLIAKK